MVLLLMSLALSACSGVTEGRKPLEFELRDGRIVVPVMVAGEGPFRFLLDTGASRSLISSRVASRVRAGAVSRTVMLTPSGHTTRPTRQVSLQVGDNLPTSVMATVMNDAEINAGAGAVDGVLGQDVLSPFVYTIDYARRVLSWDVSSCAPAEARMPLRIDDGRALVTVRTSNGASGLLQLIPDTGADGLVLFARQGRPLPAVTPLDVALLRTLAGQQVVRRVLLDRLQLGLHVLRDLAAAVVTDSQQQLPPGDGLLPLHLFSRIVMNGPEGYMVVER